MSQGRGEFFSPANIEGLFKDMQFPCSKQDLMNHAEDHDAPQQVLNAISKLPDKQYNSASEVVSTAVKSVI